MRRQRHWGVLVAAMAALWCASVAVGHYWVPDNWAQALRGSMSVPLAWAGAALMSKRRAKRRSQQPPLPSEQAPR